MAGTAIVRGVGPRLRAGELTHRRRVAVDLARADAQWTAHATAPMHARLAAEVPVGAGWRYEPTWDGIRSWASVDGGCGVTLVTRRGARVSDRFSDVAEAVARCLPLGSVVDAELIGAIMARLRGRASSAVALAPARGGSDHGLLRGVRSPAGTERLGRVLDALRAPRRVTFDVTFVHGPRRMRTDRDQPFRIQKRRSRMPVYAVWSVLQTLSAVEEEVAPSPEQIAILGIFGLSLGRPHLLAPL